MIKKYNKFITNALFESVMQSTPDFLNILNQIPSTNKIASFVKKIFDEKEDIKTNYNLIGLSDKNDEVSFLQDTQYQRYISNSENPESKTKSKSKIGRMVRQILTDNGQKVTESEIEEFVNLFKSVWDKNSDVRKIEVVKGKDILFWYDSNNYASDGGTLGNSCMRSTEKNHFMKLYSSNPDKISMVILTEKSKLFARAILWKLDKEMDNHKFYLDRIYTRFDSDAKVVYDWVYENIAKNKSDVLVSYKQGTGSSMIVNLKNVKFDAYPYADSFAYLYRNVNDKNEITDGFVSNYRLEQPKQVSIDVIASSMQETNGSTSVFSHKFSENLKCYIPSDEAVWIDSIRSYMFKKDSILCVYRGDYYLKDDVVFSEKMNDWVPKDRAKDHPKFGIIDSSQIINAVSKYIGDKSNPMAIYMQLRNCDDVEEYCEFESYIKNDTSSIFRADNTPDSDLYYFDNKLKVVDFDGREYPDFLCIKLYGFYGDDNNKIASEIGPNINDYRYTYIPNDIADFLGIKVDDNNVKYLYIGDYPHKFSGIFYSKAKELLEKSNKSDDVKKKFSDHIEEIHVWKLRYDSRYKTSYTISKSLAGANISVEQMYVDVVDNAINRSIEEIGKERLDKIILSKPRAWDPTLSDSDIKNIYKLLSPFYMKAIYDGMSRPEIIEFIKNLYPSINQAIILIAYYISFDEIRYEMSDCLTNAFCEKRDDLDISVTVSDFRRYFTDFCSKSKIFDIYKQMTFDK